MRFSLIIVLPLLLAACSSNTRSTPALSAPPASESPSASRPPKPNLLEQAGNDTWRVVTAPAQLLPKKAPPRAAPETYEAPSGIIIRRNFDDEPAVAPDPLPATQPYR